MLCYCPNAAAGWMATSTVTKIVTVRRAANTVIASATPGR